MFIRIGWCVWRLYVLISTAFYRICTPISVSLVFDIRDFMQSCNPYGPWAQWADGTRMAKRVLGIAGHLKRSDRATVFELQNQLRTNLYELYKKGDPLFARGVVLLLKARSFDIPRFSSRLALPDPLQLIRDIDRFNGDDGTAGFPEYLYLADALWNGALRHLQVARWQINRELVKISSGSSRYKLGVSVRRRIDRYCGTYAIPTHFPRRVKSDVL